MRRTFIIGFDGTDLSIANKSNILKILRLFDGDCLSDIGEGEGLCGRTNILKFYFAGPGARQRRRLFTSASGDGIENIVREAVWSLLLNSVDEADRIFVFGFSRGAVAAQMFLDFFSKVGILSAPMLDKIELYWDRYVQGDLDNREETPRLPIFQFAGFFDPVMGPSLFRGPKIPRRIVAPASLKAACAIIAANEERLQFYPADLVYQTYTAVERIVLPGEHSDIGGEIESCTVIGLLSLLVMIDRAMASGLEILNWRILDEFVASACDNSIHIGKYKTSFLYQRSAASRTSFFSDCTCFHEVVDMLHGKIVKTGRRNRIYLRPVMEQGTKFAFVERRLCTRPLFGGTYESYISRMIERSCV